MYMAVGNDLVIGRILIIFCVSFLSYYTFWVAILPLLDPKLYVHQLFPDNFYAVCIPLSLITVIFFVLVTYSQYLMKFEGAN